MLNNNQRYKDRVEQKRWELNFEFGDQLAHLRKGIFPWGKYNKLKLKQIGPCKILRKFSTNAYEIEMWEDIGISTIFNVENLYPYRIYRKEEEEYEDKVWWMQQIPIVENIQITNILD